MDYTIFAQSFGRIKSLETRLLDKTKIGGLVEAKDFHSCITMLQDSRYSEYVTTSSYEVGLKKALEDLYSEMYKISPVKEVVDILSVRYDGHNIKSLIKGKLTGIDTHAMTISAGTTKVEALDIMVKEENFRDLPKIIRESVEKALKDYKENLDPQAIEITIDKGVYGYMLETAENTEMEYLIDTVKLMVDVNNLKTFIRVKLQDRGKDFLQKVFIHGGRLDFDVFANSLNDPIEGFPGRIAHTDYYRWVKNGLEEYVKRDDLGAIERNGDNYIIDYIKKTKLASFGPEQLIAFIIAKENEIRALRIILTGKKNGVHPDIIKERLRDAYV